MKKISIVIAYYSVKMNWLPRLLKRLDDYEVKLYIYSKGGKLPVIRSIPDNVVLLEMRKCKNVGRNDETFLRYIVNHYDDLNDRVFFLKDSTMKDIRVAGGIAGKVEELEYMIRQSHRQSYVCNTTWCYDRRHEDADPELADWTLDDWNPSHKQVASSFILAKPRTVYKWVNSRLKGLKDGKKILNRIRDPSKSSVCYTGVFIATKRAIRRSKKAIYERLLAGMQNGDNLEAGHYIERLWAILFQ